jgi:hypothetical protein
MGRRNTVTLTGAVRTAMVLSMGSDCGVTCARDSGTPPATSSSESQAYRFKAHERWGVHLRWAAVWQQVHLACRVEAATKPPWQVPHRNGVTCDGAAKNLLDNEECVNSLGA